MLLLNNWCWVQHLCCFFVIFYACYSYTCTCTRLTLAMSQRNCCVTGCSNSGYRLKIWRSKICLQHNANYGKRPCVCDPPFQLLPFPSDPYERQAWIKAVNRKDVQNPNMIWQPNVDSRMCSVHFIDGKPTGANPYPTLDLGHNLKPITPRKPPKTRAKDMNVCSQTTVPVKKPKHEVLISTCDATSATCDVNIDINCNDLSAASACMQPSCSSQDLVSSTGTNNIQSNDLSAHSHIVQDHNYIYDTQDSCNSCLSKDQQIQDLKNQVSKLTRELRVAKEQYNDRIRCPFRLQDIQTDERMNFYTGVRRIDGFHKLVSVIKPKLSKIRYWNGPKTVCNPLRYKYVTKKKGPKRCLSCENELLLTLMKIRLGLLNQDLAQRFGISVQHVSNIFTTWVKVLAKTVGSLIFNPPKNVVKKNLPPSFKNSTYKSVRHIVDCTEIFLETPNNLSVRADTWSDYKHHNTAKYLISINPSGLINYVSEGWGGRTSDKYLTVHSDFLDLIEPGDKVLADRGFPIAEDLILCHAELLIPPGRRGTTQFTKDEVTKTKQIANRRIHIEQAIRRMKCFRILKYELPITLLHHLDDIVRTVAGLCNLFPPLPRYK